MANWYVCPACKRKTSDRCQNYAEAVARGDEECRKAAERYFAKPRPDLRKSTPN